MRCAPLVTSAETPEAAHGRGALMLSTGGRRRLGTHGHSSSHPAVVHGSLRGCCCCCCVDCMLSNGAITSASHTHTDTHTHAHSQILTVFTLGCCEVVKLPMWRRAVTSRLRPDAAHSTHLLPVANDKGRVQSGGRLLHSSSPMPSFFFFFLPACLPRYETTR